MISAARAVGRRDRVSKSAGGDRQRRRGRVFALKASRLARNGRARRTLLEFCALVGSLIIDGPRPAHPRSAVAGVPQIS